MQTNKPQYISVALIWFERFQEASRSMGTEFESNAVWKFYHSLLNLGEDKLAIKDIVTQYLNDIWQDKVDQLYAIAVKEYEGIEEMEIRTRKESEAAYMKDLFSYIIQVIQDSGIGWPTSRDMQSFLYTQE